MVAIVRFDKQDTARHSAISMWNDYNINIVKQFAYFLLYRQLPIKIS